LVILRKDEPRTFQTELANRFFFSPYWLRFAWLQFGCAWLKNRFCNFSGRGRIKKQKGHIGKVALINRPEKKVIEFNVLLRTDWITFF